MMNVDDIEHITVLGAGTMGHGIAEVAALAGYEVTLRDIEAELVTEGYERIEWSLDKLAEKDRIGTDEATAALDRVRPVVDLDAAVEDADVVIEAIIEDMGVKREVYGELSAVAPEDALFASNTSSLSITELSEATDRPEQFCGMHFFNPPVRMDLVEVIRGEHTTAETMDTIVGLAEAFGRTPVRVQADEPGFLVNSVLVPLLNEACWLVETDTATVAAVDSTAKYGMGLPMGAFELGDQVGIDVALHVLEYMHAELGEAYAPCPLLERYVEAEQLGQKTGEGFYDYENGGADVPADQVSEAVHERLLAVLANETGKLVAKGVAPPGDIDTAVELGAAFPKGPARFADEAGLDGLVERLEALHAETGAARYAVSEGLREAAAAGGFHEDGGGSDEDTGPAFETIRVEYPTEMVGQIILDRPQQLNSISLELLDEFERAVDHLADEDDVRALLVTGAGDRAFSAGADAMSMAGQADPMSAIELSREGQRVWGQLETVEMPVVAGIDGYCLGGGMELAACADMRIATARSELGQPEFDLGLLPGWGGTQRLRHIVGEGRAKEIIFTAEHYDPETMAEYGFLNDVVDSDEFETAAVELADDLARGPPLAMAFTKKAMHAGRNDMDAGLEAEALAFGHLIDTDDVMEGVMKLQSEEEPQFEGR